MKETRRLRHPDSVVQCFRCRAFVRFDDLLPGPKHKDLMHRASREFKMCSSWDCGSKTFIIEDAIEDRWPHSPQEWMIVRPIDGKSSFQVEWYDPLSKYCVTDVRLIKNYIYHIEGPHLLPERFGAARTHIMKLTTV